MHTICTTSLHVTRSTSGGRTYYAIAPSKGANRYSLARSPLGAWELWTERTNYSRSAPGIHQYPSLDAVGCSRKCLRDLPDAIALLEEEAAVGESTCAGTRTCAQ